MLLYLKDHQQNVKIKNMSSLFEIKLSRVPWRSMLDAIVFSIFLNDLFLCLTDSDLHNFADVNVIPVKNLNDLL